METNRQEHLRVASRREGRKGKKEGKDIKNLQMI
ncbi:hypothetical protein Nos7107_3674 [Nostoc sp. PCC 7107]|nr:hypothetical protein Nos7107_3674 [Nostoc sp. PCC 7107]